VNNKKITACPSSEIDLVSSTPSFLDIQTDPVETHSYQHVSGQSLELFLTIGGLFPPSYQTKLLIEHMQVEPGVSVCDMGAGVGPVGIAAGMLGADNVTFVEVPELFPEAGIRIPYNILLNGTPTHYSVVESNLFKAVDEDFGLIAFNPPAIPTDPDDKEAGSGCTMGGEDGRALIDRYLPGAAERVTNNGEVVIQHTSLNNYRKTRDWMRDKGFSETEYHSEVMQAHPDTPVGYVLRRKSELGAECFLHDGKLMIERRIVGFRKPSLHVCGLGPSSIFVPSSFDSMRLGARFVSTLSSARSSVLRPLVKNLPRFARLARFARFIKL
jgi:release factor glutamine methyltransferase